MLAAIIGAKVLFTDYFEYFRHRVLYVVAANDPNAAAAGDTDGMPRQ